jgi:hypothetical protein
MADLAPPPTFAEVVLVDEKTKKARFNPIWLKWFVDVAAVINAGGGTTLTHNDLSGLQGGTTAERYHLLQSQHTNITGTPAIFPGINSTDNITVPKTSGKGIRVDTASPTFPWHDIIGELKIKSPGASDPALVTYRGNIQQYQFSNAVTNEVFLEYHIPHDYLPGSDIHIHTHWSQITVDTGGPAGAPGTVKWSFDVSYAKGHNQAPFSAPITATVTQQASSTQYQHMLPEVQLSAASPSGSQLDTDDIEPDGVILVRAWRDPTDGSDTLDQAPFLHFIDVHYQSTNIGTKQKAPNFYS